MTCVLCARIAQVLHEAYPHKEHFTILYDGDRVFWPAPQTEGGLADAGGPVGLLYPAANGREVARHAYGARGGEHPPGLQRRLAAPVSSPPPLGRGERRQQAAPGPRRVGGGGCAK